jgi:tripartite-type tricarboxylate transporter receptor subunit TctC
MNAAFLVRAALGAVAAATLSVAALAADFPTRTITLVVPYAPGGQGDITARAIADNLPARIGQPVVVVNKAGGNGIIGTSFVAQAKPDGYTLAVVVASHAVSPAFNDNLPFDPVRDFVPVTTTALTEMVLVGTPTMPPSNLKEFIAYAKTRPNQLAYKSAGPGSNSHLFGAWLADATDTELLHAPYKGSGDSMRDLMAGVTQIGWDTMPAVKGYIDNKQLKLLAVGGPDRSKTFPQVETVAEAAGIAGFQANTWGMVLAPKGTPDDVVARLNREIVAVLNQPNVRQRLEATGANVVGNTPAQARDMLSQQVRMYGELVKKLDLKNAK